MFMFIRAYLRASTKEQDAKRAKSEHITFANDKCQKIATFYVENESGAILVRPKLMQLIEDAYENDVILVEKIDRLKHLNPRARDGREYHSAITLIIKWSLRFDSAMLSINHFPIL